MSSCASHVICVARLQNIDIFKYRSNSKLIATEMLYHWATKNSIYFVLLFLYFDKLDYDFKLKIIKSVKKIKYLTNPENYTISNS